MEDNSRQTESTRLDIALFERGLARSRSLASDLIKRGKISINGIKAVKPSQEIRPEDRIDIEEGAIFVSRAGEKLAFALKQFDVDARDIEALDIGSSTGGFVDCLLRTGARKVIAVDVGRDQLDQSLRNDPRVEVHEDTDIRKFTLPSLVDLVVIDVSFISLEHILPKALSFLKKNGKIIALVKPQFEVGKEIADRYRGIITDESIRHDAFKKVKGLAESIGFKIGGEAVSPIAGEKGNREFLLFLTR